MGGRSVVKDALFLKSDGGGGHRQEAGQDEKRFWNEHRHEQLAERHQAPDTQR